jgi:hypothetical protein
MATLPDTPEIAQEPEPTTIGSAFMQDDGTLEMSLRAVAADGTIGEAMMVVAPKDARYADMVKHLGGIKPGQGKPIPPFPSSKG